MAVAVYHSVSVVKPSLTFVTLIHNARKGGTRYKTCAVFCCVGTDVQPVLEAHGERWHCKSGRYTELYKGSLFIKMGLFY